MDGSCNLDLEFEYWILFGLGELNPPYTFSPFATNKGTFDVKSAGFHSYSGNISMP